jgi:hypothetical protein
MLMTASFLPSLVFSQTQVYSEPKGSRRCYAINLAKAGRNPYELLRFTGDTMGALDTTGIPPLRVGMARSLFVPVSHCFGATNRMKNPQ